MLILFSNSNPSLFLFIPMTVIGCREDVLLCYNFLELGLYSIRNDFEQ